VRTLGLLAAALGLIGFAVAVPYTHRAAAADDLLTVTPTALIRDASDDQQAFGVTWRPTRDWKQTIITVNGQPDLVQHNGGAGENTGVLFARLDFRCGTDNEVKVSIYYDDENVVDASQTVSGIVMLCPKLSSSPPKVVGPGPVKLALTDWNDDGGFDSLGTYTGDDKAKHLFLDGTELGTFGYQVAPAATVTPTCDGGKHFVRLTQQTQYGTIEASAPLEAWCSTWQVNPKGLINPTADGTNLTISDPTTQYRANTTVDVTLSNANDDNAATKSLGTITFPNGGPLSHTFSDDGYLTCGGGWTADYLINLHVNQPDPPVVIHFAPRLDPIVTDEHIPFHVICPKAFRDGPNGDQTVDQTALPYKLPVSTVGYDDDTNPYDARDIQPKTYKVDDTVIGTSSDPEFHGAVNPVCGKHTYTVTQPTGLGLASSDFPITILCPQLTLDPAVIASGSQPQAIGVQGTSFHPLCCGELSRQQPYVLTVDGKQIDNGTMDDDGAVENAFTASDLGCGVHQVSITEVDDSGGESNSAAPNAVGSDEYDALKARVNELEQKLEARSLPRASQTKDERKGR